VKLYVVAFFRGMEARMGMWTENAALFDYVHPGQLR
jgi:hypothetical protein